MDFFIVVMSIFDFIPGMSGVCVCCCVCVGVCVCLCVCVVCVFDVAFA